MPNGKRQAMINLMKLDNVPILISAREDMLEVHATPKQHMVMQAFVTMING